MSAQHSLLTHRLRTAVVGLGTIAALAVSGCSTAQAASQPQPTSQGLVVSGVEDFDGYLATIVQDAATFWQGQLSGWSATYGTGPWQQLHYSIVDSGGTVVSQCSSDQGGQEVAGDPDEVTGANPAFFCPTDMTVYLSSPWMYDHIWSSATTDDTVSDFGVAYAIAHEVGHAVQHDLGITEPTGSATVSPTELQADCLAGVWSNAKYYQAVLEGNDIDEALLAASEVGDYEYGQVGHHGTPEERSAAFMAGYDSGDAGSCTLTLTGAY